MISRLAAAAVLLCTLAASEPTAAADDASALAAFKRLAQEGVGKVDATSVFHIKTTNKWNKNRNEVRGLAYDVKRTDSLVSPLTGVITFEFYSEAGTPVETKEQAEAMPLEALTYTASIRKTTLRYAFQDDRWG